jgi:hypothetical protein
MKRVEIMNRPLFLTYFTLIWFSTQTPDSLAADVEHDSGIPQVVFAAQELGAALTEAERENLKATILLEPNAASPESFRIHCVNPNEVIVTGADASGAMYGGLEVAENLRLGISIETVSRQPYLTKRGIKFNLPLDARNPSYDDSGDAAQENVKNMWDLEGFWKPYLDTLARNRYNELSLWTCHEFPHMVDLSDSNWPNVNTRYAKNVYRVPRGVLGANSNGKYVNTTYRVSKNPPFWEQGMLDTNEDLGYRKDGDKILGDGFIDLDKLERVDGKDGIPAFDTIAAKVDHWKSVFKHAADRGISISIMHWNVYAHGAKGVDGIDESQDDAEFTRYLRHAVKQLILTYPQIETVGVAAGENDNEDNDPAVTTEDFIYQSYGLGVKDALAEQPNRKVKFLWRNHSTKIDHVYDRFVKKYDPDSERLVDVSVKYTVGRLYSSRRPMEWEGRAIGDGWLDPKKNNGYPYQVWLNVRNDDMFMHRWGSPDYVRLFIRSMPTSDCPGFLMGSDGYVWGREHISKVESLKGQLEIDKHWYNFALWGKLAYNNQLDDAYWEKVLADKYGLGPATARLLFNAWEQVSEIVPQVNRQTYAGTDAGFQAEGCMYRFKTATGFLTFDRLFLNQDIGRIYPRWPMQLKSTKVGGERQCWPVRHWVDQGKKDLSGDQISPAEVADSLDHYADAVTSGNTLSNLKAASANVDYQDMLKDLESMAHLGRYYADKLRIAIAYYEFAKTDDVGLHTQAVEFSKNAEQHWVDYANVLDSHYKPSLTARTHFLDWNSTLNNGRIENGARRGVKKETQDVKDKRVTIEFKTLKLPKDSRWQKDEGKKQTPPWLQ